MPTNAKPLWFLTGTLIVAFPVLNFFYWTEMLRAGALPRDGDSIGIPILFGVAVAILAAPILIGIGWFCFRRYNPTTRLATIRGERPVRTVLATVAFGGPAVILLFETIADQTKWMPWYEYLWTPYQLLWLTWLLTARAALIDQRSNGSE